MAGKHDIRNRARSARIRKFRRDWRQISRSVEARRRWRERSGAFDLRRIILQPFAVVERDSTDDTAATPINGRKAPLLDRTLRDHDLIAKGAHANRFYVDAELARPEGRQREMRPAFRLEAHHVMRGDLGAKDGVIPMLQGHKLIFVEN